MTKVSTQVPNNNIQIQPIKAMFPWLVKIAKNELQPKPPLLFQQIH